MYKIIHAFDSRVSTPGAAILVYHSISQHPSQYAISLRQFEEQMKVLSTYTRFVSLKDIVESVKEGTTLPGVAVTFDDGYADNLLALPILKKYQIPATFFVVSHPDQVKRKQLQNRIPLLSPRQLRMMAHDGWDIGSHTMTHPDVGSLGISEIAREVSLSKITLEKITKNPVQYFAYPNGRYTTDVAQAVKYADYEAAFAVNHAVVTPKSNQFLLPRMIIDKSYDSLTLPLRIGSGVQLVRRIVHGNPWRYAV